jgi:chemotaxis protein MotB
MALRRRGGGGEALNPWPGYVDALSTLLMVIIFVLLVFVLAQAFLSVALSGRDRALDRLNRQMAELSDMLSLERGRSADLQQTIAGLNRELQVASAARDRLGQQLAAMKVEKDRVSGERSDLSAERDRLAARLADASLQTQAAQARSDQLQGQIADLAKRGDTIGQSAATTAASLALSERQVSELKQQLADLTKRNAELTRQGGELQQQLTADQSALSASRTALTASQHRAEDAARNLEATESKLAAAQAQLTDMQKQIADMQRERDALNTTVTADKATIEARLGDLAKMAEQVRNLTALRDELEKQTQDAAVRATTEQQRREATAAALSDEKKFSDSAKAQIAAMTDQVEQLRSQIASVSAALDLAQSQAKDKDAQIANLGSRLNEALAQRVEELQRYRSDFFGKLREVLANRPGIQIVGDRFVFQSEVLFPVGAADLTAAGQDEIKQLAMTLKQISTEIPGDVNWLLRVDGHADRQPLDRGRFASNWELSAARAITVVKLLIAEGIPANRLAATGFGDNQPLDPADTPEAYAKNRRIEIRLTDR